MTDTGDRQHRSLLRSIARRAMLERGLLPDWNVERVTTVTLRGHISPRYQQLRGVQPSRIPRLAFPLPHQLVSWHG